MPLALPLLLVVVLGLGATGGVILSNGVARMTQLVVVAGVAYYIVTKAD